MPGFSCKQISTPSPKTCPKEASGNSTEPASLGVKQSAALRGDPPRQNSYSDGGGGEWGPEQRNVEKEAFHTRPLSAHARCHGRPPPRFARSRHGTPGSHGPRRPQGVPLGFLVCGGGSAERVTSRKDESPAARTRRPAGSGPRPARPGHASAGATSREASSRLERRPLGASLGRGGAGPGSPATVTQEPASSPRPRPRHARVPAAPVTREPRAPATPVTQWPWVRPPHNPGARVPAAPAPLPSQT